MAGQTPKGAATEVFTKWCTDNGGEILSSTEVEHFNIAGETELDTMVCDFGESSVKMRTSSVPQDFTVNDYEGMLRGKQTFQKSKMYMPGTDWDLRMTRDMEPDSFEEAWEDHEDEDWGDLPLIVDHKHGGKGVVIHPPE